MGQASGGADALRLRALERREVLFGSGDLPAANLHHDLVQLFGIGFRRLQLAVLPIKIAGDRGEEEENGTDDPRPVLLQEVLGLVAA